MKESVSVAFAGNPNCGKTTLFNAFTGANLKVANWPGVTVEKKEGAMTFEGQEFRLVDIPGIYSLTSYTMEEKLSRKYLLSDDADVIVDVADASALERNLYLTLQLIELGKPVVLALNMMDIVAARGMEIDLHRLPEMLGIPVVPVCARKRTGLNILMHAVAHHIDGMNHHIEHHHTAGGHIHNHHGEYAMVYSDEIEDKIDRISELLEVKYPEIKNRRWYAIKYLEYDSEILEKYPLNLFGIAEKSYEEEIINQRYDFIEEIISEVVVNKEIRQESTDRADRILTHKFWGLPVFAGIMAVVFLLTFALGDWLKGYLEAALDLFSGGCGDLLENVGVSPLMISLVVDGIIGGVGGILTFLPNIVILFIALAFLEDSGYMARVAYIMDDIMSRIGLSGRAFIPMLLGFGCTVPAVMASRALENPKDRLKTIVVTPFMSCSARLPIYVLFSEMFFGKWAVVAAFSMYILGIAVAIAVAKIFSLFSEKDCENTLLIELPEYKMPSKRTVFVYVSEKIKDYLTKAGTVIFVASVILWGLLNFGFGGLADDMSMSFAASIGKLLAPLLVPAGLGYWQIVVALISGIAAKEVVVSSMSVLFGVGNIASAEGMSALAAILSGHGFTAANGYAMMVFCLLYVPCAATIGVIHRETGSLKWTVSAVAIQLAAAWICAVIAFGIGSLLS